MEDSHYRKIFKEISEGFSCVFLEGQKVYIKHQSTSDLVEFDDVYQSYLKRALDKGLETEEQVLESLKKDGMWTEKDENEIESQTFYLESLNRNKKNIVLPSALQQVNNQIKEAEQKVKELREKKSGLISNTANQYALNRANDYYIYNSFFKDKKLENPLYTEEEFAYVGVDEITRLISTYNDFHQSFSETKIQHLAIQDFYRIYYSFTERCTDFYGKPVVELTNFQLNLILYTRIYKNIFEQHDDIPDRIKKDPAALLDFANSSEAREEMKKKFEGKGNGGSTIVGATSDDMEELGLSNPGGKSLAEAAREKGGSLSMKDLMDLSGA